LPLGKSDTIIAMADKIIEWETLEHPYYEKTQDWFWIVGIVGLTAAFLSFLLNNLLLAIILFLATIAIILHGRRVPDVITVKITGNGIHIGTEFIPFTRIKSFSIDEEESLPLLALQTNKWLAPYTHLVIEDVATEDVRDSLLDHLNEIYHEHSFTESIIHFLGF